MALGFRKLTRLLERFFPSSDKDAAAPEYLKGETLSSFLLDCKQQYLAAVTEEKGKNWTVVMGDEVGDLDTIASSVAYAWFASVTTGAPHVPLLQTPRGDLGFRTENLFAFSLASLSAERQELLCIDDLPHYLLPEPLPSDKFALVDHNRLVQRFSDSTPSASVVAVIDHHEDEGLYIESANPRIIRVPTGSCASLVTLHILDSAGPDFEIPPDLATLLLCGILIDTDGLKDGGKAVQADHNAAAYLIPRTSLALSGAFESSTITPDQLSAVTQVRDLAMELRNKRCDIEHLTTLELLRRDYKHYTFPSYWTSNRKIVHVGLVRCPTSLTSWISGEGATFWKELDSYMDMHRLDVLGILTTSNSLIEGNGNKTFSQNSNAEVAWSKAKKAKKQRQKNERIRERRRRENEEKKAQIQVQALQVLFVVRELAEDGLELRLWTGLKSPEYGLKCQDTIEDGGRKARIYEQCGTKQTRNTIAMLVRRIIESPSLSDMREDA